MKGIWNDADRQYEIDIYPIVGEGRLSFLVSKSCDFCGNDPTHIVRTTQTVPVPDTLLCDVHLQYLMARTEIEVK